MIFSYCVPKYQYTLITQDNLAEVWEYVKNKDNCYWASSEKLIYWNNSGYGVGDYFVLSSYGPNFYYPVDFHRLYQRLP